MVINVNKIKGAPDGNTHLSVQVQDASTTYNNKLSAGGFSSGADGSWLVRDNHLFILVGGYLQKLTLPQLIKVTQIQIDPTATFSLNAREDVLIIWAENAIVCTNLNCEILWTFSGFDIFVSDNGSIPFQLFPEHILLQDFVGNKYIIGYDGKSL